MFSNLLYFLIALVVYSTADLFDSGEPSDNIFVFNSVMVSFLFAVVCSMVFKRLEIRAYDDPYRNIDSAINQTISRLSVLALVVFSVNIYVFKLNLVFSGIKIFEVVPTLEALFFLGLFLFYLMLIWNAAYRLQKRYFAGEVSKKNFILSNVSFSLPALLPWFCLSIISDVFSLLPWGSVTAVIQTPAGEIAYIALFITAIAVFGPVLIRRLWHCRPLDAGYARHRIEHVCQKTGLTYADILKWELFGGHMITAGVMGLIGRFRYILVTPALLNSLNDEELDAVMLHEIGHVQRHHMFFYLCFFAGFIACNFVFFEPVLLLLYTAGPIYDLFALVGIERDTAHPIIISTVLIAVFILYFRFVFGYFMRNCERQADLHLYRFGKDGFPLISTLYKIASLSRQAIDKPNWHHFSIGQRIRFLERCQENPSLIQAHHSHIKKIMTGYFILVTLLFSVGYAINYGAASDVFGNYIAEKILLQQLEVQPENSEMYALVGDYYYNNKNYGKAIDSYENVLRVDPENVHALNNLSWLFATCPNHEYRNEKKALENAKRALEQKREAFVLDTYAEALFVNNDIPNAVNAAREALHLSKDKKAYYRSQLGRFERMMTP